MAVEDRRVQQAEGRREAASAQQFADVTANPLLPFLQRRMALPAVRRKQVERDLRIKNVLGDFLEGEQVDGLAAQFLDPRLSALTHGFKHCDHGARHREASRELSQDARNGYRRRMGGNRKTALGGWRSRQPAGLLPQAPEQWGAQTRPRMGFQTIAQVNNLAAALLRHLPVRFGNRRGRSKQGKRHVFKAVPRNGLDDHRLFGELGELAFGFLDIEQGQPAHRKAAFFKEALNFFPFECRGPDQGQVVLRSF